jgi:hypothetical protein
MGPGNRFSGKGLLEYRIQATAGSVDVDFTLTADVPAWRPATGHMLFGPDEDLEFNWLPAVPQGTVRGSYTVDHVRHETTGVGYHDHNWGNVGMQKIIHDWYWGRGQAGPYTVIASFRAYLRFAGSLTIEHLTAGRSVEKYTEGAIWELMYFGHARPWKSRWDD